MVTYICSDFQEAFLFQRMKLKTAGTKLNKEKVENKSFVYAYM